MFKCLDFQMPRCLMAYMFKCLITPCSLLSSCTLYMCHQPPHALSTSMLLCKMIRCYLQHNPQLPATSHMMHTTCCNMRDATELCTNAQLHNVQCTCIISFSAYCHLSPYYLQLITEGTSDPDTSVIVISPWLPTE